VLSKEQIENGGFKNEGLVNLICGVSEDKKNLLLERGKQIPSDQNVNEVVKYFD
jgi:hypothetical protein